MTKKDRLEIIKEIQSKRDSLVLCYVTGDRPNLPFQIGTDTPRLFFDHLKHLASKIKRLDLFLYSAGGETSVPWRIVSLLREFSEELNVLVPYRAYSAATLLAMGADKIVMGRKGELGPIDPAVANDFNPIDPISKSHRLSISVEDVYSYISLVKEKIGIVHQPELGAALNALSSQIHPLSMGYVNRHSSFIRMIASKMLKCHKNPPTETKIEEIVKNLVEKIYFHGHGISRGEARELGLEVEDADKSLEDKLWKLYLQYEEVLNLKSVFNPQDELDAAHAEEITIGNIEGAFIESEKLSHVFRGDLKVAVKRQIPQTVNLSVNLQLPPNILEAQVDQQQLQQLQAIVQQMVMNQIRSQAPIIGHEVKFSKIRWDEESGD